MNKKDIIKAIVFLFILFVIMYFLFKILWLNPTAISLFYEEPKNSLDIVFTGASTTYRCFNTVLAYNLYGYTSGILSSSAQPFILTEYLIKESEKYQNPSLYVIDIGRVGNGPEDDEEGNIRTNTDSMKFSKNRTDAINAIMEYKNIDSKQYVNLNFSFLMYHNKWKRISKENLVGAKNYYKGYSFLDKSAVIKPIEKYTWMNDEIELQEKNEEILNSLINYIKDNNLNVLFIVPKKIYREDENKRINSAIKIIQDNNMNVVNFNTIEEFNDIIDINTNFYDNDHLNVYGATKYTLYLAKYLNENYEFKDHRKDGKYNSWSKEYERFKSSFKKITNKEFDELLLEYNI